MGSFKNVTVMFLILQLLLLQPSFSGKPQINCVAGSNIGQQAGESYFNILKAVSGFEPTGTLSVGLEMLGEAYAMVVNNNDVYGEEPDCYDALVRQLEDVFVTKAEFEKYKNQMDEFTAKLRLEDLYHEKQQLKNNGPMAKDITRVDVYLHKFQEYLEDVSKNVKMFMMEIENFNHPIQKISNLILASAYIQDLTTMSGSFSYMAWTCRTHPRGNCAASEIKTFSNALKSVASIITVCKDLYWKIERSLYDARKNPQKILAAGGVRGHFDTIDYNCAPEGPGYNEYTNSGAANKQAYKRRATAGVECEYKDTLYVYDDKAPAALDDDQKWGRLSLTTGYWNQCTCGSIKKKKNRCYAHHNDANNICGPIRDGYPRVNKANWLAHNQRVKLQQKYNQYFKDRRGYDNDKLITYMACNLKWLGNGKRWIKSEDNGCMQTSYKHKLLILESSQFQIIARYGYSGWFRIMYQTWHSYFGQSRRQLILAEQEEMVPLTLDEEEEILPLTPEQEQDFHVLSKEEEEEFCNTMSEETVQEFFDEHGAIVMPVCNPEPGFPIEFLLEEADRTHELPDIAHIHGVDVHVHHPNDDSEESVEVEDGIEMEKSVGTMENCGSAGRSKIFDRFMFTILGAGMLLVFNYAARGMPEKTGDKYNAMMTEI